MAYLSDIEIAQQCKMKPITEIAKKAKVDEKYIEQYGNYKAKIDLSLLNDTNRKDGKLVLIIRPADIEQAEKVITEKGLTLIQGWE